MNNSIFQILCVDNDIESCHQIISMLDKSGTNYAFTKSSNAHEALNLIERQAFDLYLIDTLLMKEMNGIELCRRIRLSDAETPIIFFDTVGDKFLQMEAIKFGANDYLVKPLIADKTRRKVEQLLAEKRMLDEIKSKFSYVNDKPTRIFSFV